MKPELTQNLWERYGFSDNPFDTRALSMSPENKLSVSKAFIVGESRQSSVTIMNNFLRGRGGGRIVVEGAVGVGKTTFVNYHRYKWEYEAGTKLLTPVQEISVQADWGVREFLISILAATAGRLALAMKPKEAQKDDLLNEISALTGVLFKQTKGLSGGLSAFGFGANVSGSKAITVQIGEISTDKLKQYLHALLERIHHNGYAGALFHLNNLELLARKDIDRLRYFFDDIRDFLQIENLYFIFVGYVGMFQEAIAPTERVRSIFLGKPIVLPVLSLEEVLSAIQKRYELLAIQPEHWIPPVDNDLIVYLYHAFEGKIRFIMDAITTLVIHLPESATATMSSEAAKLFLRELTFQNLEILPLTKREIEELKVAIRLTHFTNSELSKALKKKKQQITKLINRLMHFNLIYQTGQEGKHKYYTISPELMVCKENKE